HDVASIGLAAEDAGAHGSHHTRATVIARRPILAAERPTIDSISGPLILPVFNKRSEICSTEGQQISKIAWARCANGHKALKIDTSIFADISFADISRSVIALSRSVIVARI